MQSYFEPLDLGIGQSNDRQLAHLALLRLYLRIQLQALAAV